jgi:hypothetical protein
MLKQKAMQTQSGKPHRFQRGNQYGRGRPQGSRNTATIALQALLDGEGEAITRVVVERAKSGDATALRLCLERLIPEKKDRTVTLNFGSIGTTTGVAQALDTLLQAVGSGEITPAEASTLASVLETRRRVIETQELEQRIAKLEDAHSSSTDRAG